MYKVTYDNIETNCSSLDEAMRYAKKVNKFVVIQGPDFEVCGVFGVDTVKNGKTPDGVAYTWNKASRIGRVKKNERSEICHQFFFIQIPILGIKEFVSSCVTTA